MAEGHAFTVGPRESEAKFVYRKSHNKGKSSAEVKDPEILLVLKDGTKKATVGGDFLDELDNLKINQNRYEHRKIDLNKMVSVDEVSMGSIVVLVTKRDKKGKEIEFKETYRFHLKDLKTIKLKGSREPMSSQEGVKILGHELKNGVLTVHMQNTTEFYARLKNPELELTFNDGFKKKVKAKTLASLTEERINSSGYRAYDINIDVGDLARCALTFDVIITDNDGKETTTKKTYDFLAN